MFQRNELRETIERGEPVLGARAMSLSPMLIEVYGGLGLDFVWLDFEHSGQSADDSPGLEHYARAAAAADTDLLVRIPDGEPALVRKVLDASVRNILIPRVETAAEVEAAVRASQFAYDGDVGDRGAAAARVNNWGQVGGTEYSHGEDESVLVGAMIENSTAIDNLEDILAVPDLGFVFIGPSDLSVSMGYPFETDRPEVREAIRTVRDACVDAGVPVGCIVNDGAGAAARVAEGYQILRIGGEVEAVRQVVGERIETFRAERDE